MSNDGRRDALSELKLLLGRDPKAQRAVGQIGLHVLLSIARDERDDVDLVRGALEALLQALTPVPAEHVTPSAGVSPAAVNTELLGRETRHVALLLELLDDADLYVRYHALQVLSALLPAHAAVVQQVVLASPVGVARLVDLVSDQEVVRNEALLLLTAMARGKEDIQKLLAFEGAFERLLAIVRDEGGPEGGVVVQDCLELVNSLLRSCAPNQRLFREIGLLGQVPQLLVMKARGANTALSRQAAANILCALETTCLLLSPCADDGDAAVKLHQTAFGKADLMSSLLPLALGARAAFSAVTTAALLCASMLVSGHSAAQEALGNATIACEGSATPEPALLCALRTALQGDSEPLRCAAVQLVAAYCNGNPEGQQLLVSTMIPMGGLEVGPSDQSFGRQLSAALTSDNVELAARAARLLQPLVVGNTAAKERLLRIPLDATGQAVPELILARCTRLLAHNARASAGERTSVLLELLRLLSMWLYDCPPAVSAFLASPGHLPLLIDLTSSHNIHVAGTSAAVLAACVVSNKSASGECDAHTVLDAIVSRISLPQYFQRWEVMLSSAEYISAASSSRGVQKPLVTRETAASSVDGDIVFPGGAAASVGVYYSSFVAFALQTMEACARKQLLALYARPAAHSEGLSEAASGDVSRLQALLHAKEMELGELQARLAALERQGQNSGYSTADASTIARIRQDAERDLAAARAETAEARAMVARHEDSLRALSLSYNALEASHSRLEQELQRTRDPSAPVEASQAGAGDDTQAEHEEEMNDLLVVLGQEEGKVERLCEALRIAGHTQDEIDAILTAE